MSALSKVRFVLKSKYEKLHVSAPRLHKHLYPYVIFIRSFLIDLGSAPRQFLQIDLIRFLICTPKFLIKFILLRRYRVSDLITDGISKNTLIHNMRGGGELSAPRSHLLIRPIITIDKIRRNIQNLKVLSVGPRVEGEIFNLLGYGFSLENITGLDLFSYSSRIDVGDMHNLPYADNSFDVVIFGWVLGYSDNKVQCANELNRVCKNGGVIAVGNGYYELSDEDVIRQGGLKIGSEEKVQNLDFIERLFSPCTDNIYFRYDGSKDRINGAPIILIYEVSKQIEI